MSQRPSKLVAKAAASGRRDAPGGRREVPAKPIAPNRTARAHIHPAGPEGSAGTQSATGAHSYLQWAAFMAGAQSGDFGFGAYFVDEASAGMVNYTWTPSGRG
jgi:hypothetical protein